MPDAQPSSEAPQPRGRLLSRRRFLGGAAALAGTAAAAALAASLPRNLRHVVTAPTPTTTPFHPSQVKHVVILMQENRSFDHYFGALAGVRGFGDRNAVTLPGGRPVFYQPDRSDPGGYRVPFHLDSATTAAQIIPSTSHAWDVQHRCWNHGAMDQWLPAHIAADGADVGPYTMGYFTEADLPFHYALANHFTICDNYFCSVLGPTNPNRFMLMSATIDPTGAHGGPALDNSGDGFTWQTYAEALQAAGVTWKVYQEADNFNCNALQYFRSFTSAAPLSPLQLHGLGVSTHHDGSPAADPAMAFEDDAAAGTLPSVSWIIPTSTESEHPAFLPAAGANFVASKLNAIAGNPELWASTVFILNYDENDGLFDHVPPPVAPPGTPGEFVGDLPVGAGFRVPCLIVSPWTMGGYVCSDAFDHTSTLQFLQAVTGVAVPNLTPWRAATFGNLLSAFRPAAVRSTRPDVPSTVSTAAELAAQQLITETKPLPVFPGPGLSPPAPPPGRRPRVG
jgi:phospholipase C